MDRTESKIRALQVSTRTRSVVLTCGMTAFGYFMLRPAGPGALAHGMGMFAVGLVVQLCVLAATALVKRHVADTEIAAQSVYIVELVGDAITVLFFVMGTIRAIGYASEAL
jgi:hypothetical protein